MQACIARLILVEILVLSVGTVILSWPVQGEEAGTGHYLPGTTASFIDMLPDRDAFTLVYANAFTYYEGSGGPSKDFELGGQIAANVKATIYAETSLFLLQTPWKLFGGAYGGSIVVPYYWLEIQGEVLAGTKVHVGPRADDAANGFGDIELLPLMFGWKFGGLKLQTQFGIYAPTAGFDKGDLANLGKNYWTFEPAIAASYLSSKFGLELTGFAGLDFNTKNDTTNYQTGDQFHFDATGAQHLPLFGGFGGIGATGFYYKQFTADSGGGARLGGFEGMTTGVGPVASYAYRIGDVDLAGEAKWLPEISTSNRLNGNIVWFKIGLSYASNPEAPLPAM